MNLFNTEVLAVWGAVTGTISLIFSFIRVKHTIGRDKIKLTPTLNRSKFYENDNQQIFFEAIHITVMVRPASLGVILERIERIGVGTNCGTLAVFKAELCKTASPLAHQAPMEEDNKSTEQMDGAESNRKAVGDAGTVVTTTDMESNAEAMVQARAIEAAKAEWKNAATRLRVEQVREQVRSSSRRSFVARLGFMTLMHVFVSVSCFGLLYRLSSRRPFRLTLSPCCLWRASWLELDWSRTIQSLLLLRCW